MKITALISRVTEQYKASEALVLPVEAQAARLAPIMRAWVKAADMPLSLKLPEGFMPSYCRNSVPGSSPTYSADAVGRCSSVCPSPIVTTISAGANGQQLVKPPHAAKRERLVPPRPFAFKPLEFGGGLQAVPVVDDVQQLTTIARHAHFVHSVRRPAVGRNAPLEGEIGFGSDTHWTIRNT